MKIYSPYVTGSLIVSGSVTIITPSGSVANVNALSASLAQTASYISPTFISASAAASGFGSGGSESDPIFAAWSASAASKFAGTSSLALTASYSTTLVASATNGLAGDLKLANSANVVLQTIYLTASRANTASFVDQLNQNVTINGNLSVLGTASFQFVTASQLAISQSYISVNVFEPQQRFGGLYVFDSGSSNATASLTWDSLNNRWIYSNASGSTYMGGMLLAGPRNTGALGSETALTQWFVPRSDGGDHLNDTQIYSSASIHQVTGSLFVSSSNNTQLQVGNSLLFVSSSGNVGIGTTTPATALEVIGVIRTSQMSIGGLDSGRNQFLTYTNGPVYRMFAGSVYASLGVGSLSVGSTYGAISGSANTVLIEGNTSIGTTSASLARLQIQGSGATSATTALRIENSNTSPLLVVRNNTSVGIGTATPSAPLEVVGNTIISGTLDVSGSGRFTNELVVTGSLIAPTITGSLQGSASYALTASYALNGGGGGGVSQIVAGTNVTISPTNGLGVVTINSSGGGGGSITSIVAGPGVSVQNGSGPTVTINATQQTNLGLTYAIAMGYLMP